MRKPILILGIALILLIMLGAAAAILIRPPATNSAQKLPYGQPVQLDDFAFSALDAQRANTIGDQTAQGIYYIVTLKVENNAKVVDFQFRPNTAALVDNTGIEHTPSPAATQAWFSANGKQDPCAAAIPAGTTCTTTLVYDVPAATAAPVIRMSMGGTFGEFADALLTGNRVLQLK